MTQINEDQPFVIEKNKILLVEGKDEVTFFKALFKKKNMEDIQVKSTNGKDDFKNDFVTLKNTPGFEKVTSLAIIQDADSDPQSRFNSICSTLKKCRLSVPDKIGLFTESTPKIGIFIIPDGKSEGMLESLCLSTVESKEKETMKCIDEFMECIEIKSKKPKNKDKSRLQAFLAAVPKNPRSLGEAAKMDYWNFDSDKLDPLLEFVEKNITTKPYNFTINC